MAKVTLGDIDSLANVASAKQELNDNFTALEQAIENSLSRLGTAPNAMQAELDMGSHKILNVADPVADADGVNLRSVRPLVDQYVGEISELLILSTLRVEPFTATAGQTTFELLGDPGTAENAEVYDTGVWMEPGVDYVLTGTSPKSIEFLVGRALDARIVVRYADMSPTDGQLRSDLANGAYGSELVAHTPPVASAPSASYLKYTSDILNGLEVPIDIFLRNSEISSIRNSTSTYDASGDFQTAFSAASVQNGIKLLIPPGLYNINSQVRTFHDNVHMRGVGRPKLQLATGQAAGYQTFAIYNNHFSARDLRLESSTRSHTFYIQPQSAVDLTGFKFINLEGNGLFYMVRGDGAADRKILDVLVQGCKNVAPVGQASGHFLIDHGIGVQYLGNTIKYGRNTSGYGVADSKNIVIVGNIEQALEDTVALVEAACQIEDSDLSNAVIQGNSFEHDIWIAGSNGVAVTGNTCRRMRLSVGNADGYDVHDVLFSGNKAAQIHAALFGGAVPERINARFLNNVISPAGRTLNGADLSMGVYAEGTYVEELTLQGNIFTTDATTNGLVISRSATSNYRLYDNDFGTKVHSVSGGSVGGLYERGNRNKATKTANGYLQSVLTSIGGITLGTFTVLPFNSDTVDVNAEHSNGVITIRESGTYRFSGHVTVDPDGAGSEMGFTIKRTSGTPAELYRTADLYAQNATSHGVPFATPALYLNAGDVLEIQYRLTGATSTFLTGANLTWFQMERLD